MNRVVFVAVVICVLAFRCSVFAADFYVASETGDDKNTGLAEDQAWKTLAPLNAHAFAPGDRLLLKTGSRFTGQLKLSGSGSPNAPIELTTYGSAPGHSVALPRIDAEGKSLDALLLQNVEFWQIHDLEITNHARATAPFRTGVRLESDNNQTLHGIILSGLYVHDVNGDLRKEQEGCGIFFNSRGRQSNFDGLTIENCHIVRTDRNGICQRNFSRTRSTHVIIRNNLLEDIGGDGIKLWGTNGGLIEHNTLHGGRMRCDDYAAGIWPFDSDDTIIQYNEVSGMKGIKDGEGFDSDYQSSRNIFQYNYSHDNDGGFILLCSPGSSHCDGTIVRYNISQNDGQTDSQVFHIAGNVTNSLIYNNLIFVGEKQSLPLLRFDDWQGYSNHTTFNNNVFYVNGKVSYIWTKSTGNAFDFNWYYGNHVEPPTDPHALTSKPPLTNPGTGRDGLDSLAGYKWQKAAHVPQGATILDHGGKDFFGNPLPANGALAVGVNQPAE